jgi:hypothetical protein
MSSIKSRDEYLKPTSILTSQPCSTALPPTVQWQGFAAVREMWQNEYCQIKLNTIFSPNSSKISVDDMFHVLSMGRSKHIEI